ncbi:hypothetical protein D9756_009179 [Leucocoprinus leucothites]|uniref:Methyltransferase domain-containing protein n=1 Tax=Leucocoprinus leucothites TaxID=201217 RepID=A0A8H5CZL6_9AGAR|nr:hypothetical protein D9756_009179 [Leucoagaricus leucothites]
MSPVLVDSPAKPLVQKPKRYYVSESSRGYNYILPADEEERERLNSQSEAINQIFDNKLIWAPISLKNGDIVLDSGTGSGHWLLSLANERDRNHKVPSIHLRGIDISSRMFPLPSLTPRDTNFTTHSITSLPLSWSNTISLIHQRLVYLGLQAPQWTSALSEMYRVLVPGGWIQLFEPRYPSYVSPSAAIRNHKAFQLRNKLGFEKRQVVMDIVYRLPEWIEKTGFVNLKVEKRHLPMGASWAGESSASGVKAVMGVWRALKEPVMKAGGLGIVRSEEEYDAVIEDLGRLCEETPETYFEFWVFTAQKPALPAVQKCKL